MPYNYDREGYEAWNEDMGATSSAPTTNNPKELEGMKKAARCHIPATSLAALHAAHNNGAAKYGHFNWRKEGVDVQTYLSACERHIEAFKAALSAMQEPFEAGEAFLYTGEDLVNMGFDEIDPATGIQVPHLGGAVASLSILHDALVQGMLTDNYSTPEVLDKVGGKPSNAASQQSVVNEEKAEPQEQADDASLKAVRDRLMFALEDADEEEERHVPSWQLLRGYAFRQGKDYCGEVQRLLYDTDAYSLLVTDEQRRNALADALGFYEDQQSGRKRWVLFPDDERLDALLSEEDEPSPQEDLTGKLVVLTSPDQPGPNYGVVREMSVDGNALRFAHSSKWDAASHYREATNIERSLISNIADPKGR